jgi:hypothetical protein
VPRFSRLGCLLPSVLLGVLSIASLGGCASSQPSSTAITAPIVTPAPSLDRVQVRAALATRRAETMKRFVAFREARVYPMNTATDTALHIWVDPYGTLCAAATLVSLDWGVPASQAIGAENNAIDLADVHDGAIADWILTTGLTQGEVVAIQRPAPPRPREPDAAEVARTAEIERRYQLWVAVEHQLTASWEASLDAATDALIARPALARQLLGGVAAGPGRYAATPSA